MTDVAKRMGVRPERVLKLIHDGRIAAQKVGNQWVIDDDEISAKIWVKSPGRPLSARSGLALAEALEGREPDDLNAVGKHRLRKRLEELRAHDDPKSQLTSWLSARAESQDFSVGDADIPELRKDPRIKLSGVSDPRSGLLPGREVEAYVSERDLVGLISEWFLVPATSRKKANVILRAVNELPAEVPVIFSAMDLAERPGPREQAAADSMIRSVIDGN